MPYWEIVTRSFKITWRHKYLWLLALFAGESGGGFNFNSGSFTPPGTNRSNRTPDLNAINQQVSQWVADHGGLIVAARGLLLPLPVAFFLLGALGRGAAGG